MKQEQFKNIFNNMVDEELNILKTKNEEYSKKNEDKLANFNTTAKDLGIPPRKVCYIFLKKHLDSIANFVKQGHVESEEDIYGRIADARNYLYFLRCTIEEERNES